MPDRPSDCDAKDDTATLVAALGGLSEPLLAIDPGQRLYYANRAALTLLDIEAAALPRELTRSLPDRALATTLQRVIEAAAGEPPGLLSHEFLWRHDQQSYAVRVQAVDEGHLILFLRATPKSPLNERLISEYTRRFWATALAGIGSWTWDVENQRLRSDSILTGFTGPDSDHRVPAEIMLEHVHPDDRAGLKGALLKAIEGPPQDETEIDFEFRFSPDDRREIWMAMRGGVIRDANDEPVMLAGVHFDVTERKLAEQAVSQAKQALEEANRAKDSFLAKVSHEIRTPLTTILGYADLCLARARNEQDRRELDPILDSGRHLQRLVDDLLDLSRIIAGKISIDRQALDLRRLGEELMSSMHLRASEKHLSFTVEIDPELPQRISTDPVRVRQILHNLAGNAIKFTRLGAVSVRALTRSTGSDRYIAFEVQDTGPGIPPHKLEGLFEPFAQTRRSDSARFGGLGLGLAISRRLARMLDGDIEVETGPGRGSTFTLVLPMIESDDEPSSAGLERSEGTRPPSLPALSCRILAIDDVPSIRHILNEYLGTAGAEVSTAANGPAALAQLAEAERSARPFDLVLIDLYMPYPDGYQTLRRLREEGHRAPAIALSASAMNGERERALSAGFVDFIAKPFSAFELADSAARALTDDGGDSAAAAMDPDSADTLLLVEDHEALARLTAEQVSKLGYRVEVAYTGAAAIDRARAIAPSAMIIDLSLPDMDGIELCRALCLDETFAGCRIIAYTGSEEPEQHALARDAGFTDVLVKPAQTADFALALTTKR